MKIETKTRCLQWLSSQWQFFSFNFNLFSLRKTQEHGGISIFIRFSPLTSILRKKLVFSWKLERKNVALGYLPAIDYFFFFNFSLFSPEKLQEHGIISIFCRDMIFALWHRFSGKILVYEFECIFKNLRYKKKKFQKYALYKITCRTKVVENWISHEFVPSTYALKIETN